MAAVKGAGNSTVTYNSNALTSYVNSVDLQNTIAELEATHLASTAQEADAGLGSYQLQMGGDWNPTLDGYLGPDSLTGTKRTAAIAFTAGGSTVTYTWTSQAFITNYSITTSATGKLEWKATLRLSGAGSRGVA